MLNAVNLLTSFKERLVDQREKILAVIEPYVNAIVDDELDLDITWQPGGFETEINKSKYDAYKLMFDALVSKSFQLTDGVVFGIVTETITDASHVTYVYKDGMHDNEEICRLIRAEEGPYTSYFIGWNGWDVAHRSTLGDNLRSFYDGLLDAESISTAAMTAIDLCCKGQLDPTNFSAMLTNFGMFARDSVKETVNLILANVSGKDAFEQAKGLILAFQQLYSGAMPGNITVDDDRINFHPLEYSISSALMLPLDGIISSVAGVVGMIISAFGYPIGFVVSAAGSAVSGLLNIAETSLGNDWNISALATLDNEACCLPILSGTYYAKDLPSKLVSYTKKYGYLRSENSLYTVYSWMESENSQDHDYDRVNIEIFFNVNVDMVAKYATDNALADNALTQYLESSMSRSDNSWSFSCTTKSGCKDIIDTAFDQRTTLTDSVKVQYPSNSLRVFEDWQNRYITYNMILQFAFYCTRLMALSNNYVNFHTGDYGDDVRWFINPLTDPAESYTLSECQWYIGEFLAWVKTRLSNGTFYHWSNVEMPSLIKNGDWVDYTAALINAVYPITMRMRELIDNDNALINDFFTVFDSVIDMGDILTDNGEAILGRNQKWSPSPCITYETEFLVSPPKNRYNFTTRLIMTALVTVAIATVTAITTSQLKKRIAWKTFQKQKELNQLRDKFVASGSYTDFDNLYKATKRYNRSYGILTGTSFDMSNSWVNERTSSGIFTSTSDVFPALVSEDPVTGQASIDLSPVIKLIKPID